MTIFFTKKALSLQENEGNHIKNPLFGAILVIFHTFHAGRAIY